MRNAGNQKDRVVLITGASSGFGRVAAREFRENGWRVFGTTRSLERVPKELEQIDWLEMDVREDGSVRTAVSAMLESAGHIDAVVNNAGIAMLGALEETSIDEAKELFETNVFGLLRVTQAVLPAMRKQRSGTIVMMSSLAGFFGVPFHGAYSATKHAVEAMTQALRLEVEPFGIRVAVIEPEAHRTGIVMMNPSDPLQEYDERRTVVGRTIEHQIRTGPRPENVGRLAYRIVMSRQTPFRFPIGRKAAFLGLLIRLLPQWGGHQLAKMAFRLS